MAVYLGIDPGAKGCLCFLDSSTKKMAFLPTPCLEFSAREIWKTTVATHGCHHIAAAAIEDVHSIYGMSAKSNFQFGWNVGAINTLLEITGIGFERVAPKVWQKGVGITARRPARKPPELKKAIAELALRLYPDAPILGPRGGILDGRSDSLMIAHYLLLKYGESK
jgi:crossover junction endodeoxyribonuclease RuvC